jgi:hypothetical protein
LLIGGGFALRGSLARVNSGVGSSSADEKEGGVYSQKIGCSAGRVL